MAKLVKDLSGEELLYYTLKGNKIDRKKIDRELDRRANQRKDKQLLNKILGK